MRWMLILIVIGLVFSAASIPSWGGPALATTSSDKQFEVEVQVNPDSDVAVSDIDCLIAPQYPNGEICVQTFTFNEMEIAGSI